MIKLKSHSSNMILAVSFHIYGKRITSWTSPFLRVHIAMEYAQGHWGNRNYAHYLLGHSDSLLRFSSSGKNCKWEHDKKKETSVTKSYFYLHEKLRPPLRCQIQKAIFTTKFIISWRHNHTKKVHGKDLDGKGRHTQNACYIYFIILTVVTIVYCFITITI